ANSDRLLVAVRTPHPPAPRPGADLGEQQERRGLRDGGPAVRALARTAIEDRMVGHGTVSCSLASSIGRSDCPTVAVRSFSQPAASRQTTQREKRWMNRLRGLDAT